MSRCGSCPAYGCGAFGVHCSGDYGVEECSDTLQELYNATANELHRLKNQTPSDTDEGIKKALTDWCPEVNRIMLQRGGEDRMRILVVEPTRKPEVREISGTFFLCGAPPDSDHFTSLTPEQIGKYEERFHTPEMFWGMDGRIVCLPLEVD